MPTFGESLLQGFLGAQGVRDYSHAAWTFVSNSYELSPRFKYLFHVYFNINTGEIPALQQVFGGGDQATVGMLVKTVQTPSFSINTDTLNQYNRKRIIQTGIKYEPIQIVMHDDQGDLVRNMWYNYYSYYFKDPSQKYEGIATQNGTLGRQQTLANGFGYNSRDIYSPSRQVSDWGYIGEAYQDSSSYTGSTPGGKPPFFKDIRIYGLSQKRFASWVLINPVISEWIGDTYDYNDGGGTMSNTLKIEYETVKYYTGAVGGATPSNTVAGFADPGHYDNLLSPIARPGSRTSVFGQGGLMDAGAGILQDLEAATQGRGSVNSLIGGVQMAATAWYTFKNQNIGSIAYQELQENLPMIIRQGLPAAARSLAGGGPNSQFYPYNSLPNISGLNPSSN